MLNSEPEQVLFHSCVVLIVFLQFFNYNLCEIRFCISEYKLSRINNMITSNCIKPNKRHVPHVVHTETNGNKTNVFVICDFSTFTFVIRIYSSKQPAENI